MLPEEVAANKVIIQSTLNSEVTNQRKGQLWQDFARKGSSCGVCVRTPDQVREKLSDMKKDFFREREKERLLHTERKRKKKRERKKLKKKRKNNNKKRKNKQTNKTTTTKTQQQETNKQTNKKEWGTDKPFDELLMFTSSHKCFAVHCYSSYQVTSVFSSQL